MPAFTPYRRAYRPNIPKQAQTREISPIMHIDNVIFLILSKHAYTKYSDVPRKILGYRTPDELFDAELDRIYAL